MASLSSCSVKTEQTLALLLLSRTQQSDSGVYSPVTHPIHVSLCCKPFSSSLWLAFPDSPVRWLTSYCLCFAQAWNQIQATHAGADRHKQHCLLISLRSQQMAGGQDGTFMVFLVWFHNGNQTDKRLGVETFGGTSLLRRVSTRPPLTGL